MTFERSAVYSVEMSLSSNDTSCEKPKTRA